MTKWRKTLNGGRIILNPDLSRPVLGEGQSYQMLQLHFHWGADNTKGSEHTINGEEFPMEMHIVHKKVGLTVEEALGTSDGLAVVGQMFQVALFQHLAF